MTELLARVRARRPCTTVGARLARLAPLAVSPPLIGSPLPNVAATAFTIAPSPQIDYVGDSVSPTLQIPGEPVRR